MDDAETLPPNKYFIEVAGAGLPEVDGLFVPSTAPPAKSESGTVSTTGYWNGKLAWDRADGNSERSPAFSYSNTYKSWRICRADGHLAYDITSDDALPPTDREWHVYKKGVAPAPKVVLHHFDRVNRAPIQTLCLCLAAPAQGRAQCASWLNLSWVGSIFRPAN